MASKSLTLKSVLKELTSKVSVSVPTAGFALGELGRGASYAAAKEGTLGVPVYEVGGQLRVPSLAVLQKLGLAETSPVMEGTKTASSTETSPPTEASSGATAKPHTKASPSKKTSPSTKTSPRTKTSLPAETSPLVAAE
jgi:hypothetical protein